MSKQNRRPIKFAFIERRQHTVPAGRATPSPAVNVETAIDLLCRGGMISHIGSDTPIGSFFVLVFIGAIMTEEQRGGPTEQLFKYAVERINRDPELLPNTTLLYDIHYVDREDSWHASKKGMVIC